MEELLFGLGMGWVYGSVRLIWMFVRFLRVVCYRFLWELSDIGMCGL